jgi:hypothetical protein
MSKRVAVAALIGAGLVVGAICARATEGGNYVNNAAKYYSVELTLGQYMTHPSRIVVVDDITYAVYYQPCEPAETCQYFGPADIPNIDTSSPYWDTSPPFGGPIPGGTQIQTWTGVGNYVESTIAKAHYGEVLLTDSDGTSGNSLTFDRCSFVTYGELATRSWREHEGTFMAHYPSTVWAGGGPQPDPVLVKNPTPALALMNGFAVPHAMPMAIAMAPSSPSRHYQSPHVVRHTRVYFTTPIGLPSAVVAGKVQIKGRTFDRLVGGVPEIDADMVITTP